MNLSPVEVAVDASGQIQGIKVVGFHGEVDPSHTPARCAPIWTDSHNRLVRVLDIRQGSVLLERGVPLAEASEKGVGTFFDKPFPAMLDSLVVVLGNAERASAAQLVQIAQQKSTGAEEFFRLLQIDQVFHPQAIRLGGLLVFHVSSDEAVRLLDVVLTAARDATTAAVHDRALLESRAWWLSRAALNDDDIYFAGAALRIAGSRHADSMIRAGLNSGHIDEDRVRHAMSRLTVTTPMVATRTLSAPLKGVLVPLSEPAHRFNVAPNPDRRAAG